MAHNFIDAALNVRVRQVLSLEQETHEAHQGVLRRRDQVLVPHNVKWLLLLIVAVMKQNVEELLHLQALPANEIIPPLGVVLREVIVRLVPVTQGVTKRCEGRENVERVPDTDERLVGLFGSA